MGNFFKQIFANLIGTLLGLMLFTGVITTGLVILIFAFTISQSIKPAVKNNSVLVFKFVHENH